jgi:Mg/Co/Ni transporter MgtE
MSRVRAANKEQSTFPVVDPTGKLLGVVESSAIAFAADTPADEPSALASDLMQPAPIVRATDDLRKVAELFLSSGLPQLHIVDANGGIEGVIDESDITRTYLTRVAGASKT